MSLEYFANLAEVVGVILVIASLIYVAKQLRQNTNAIRAQSRQSVLAASQAELFVTIDYAQLRAPTSQPLERRPEAERPIVAHGRAVERERPIGPDEHHAEDVAAERPQAHVIKAPIVSPINSTLVSIDPPENIHTMLK